jgi:hypothetical protein
MHEWEAAARAVAKWVQEALVTPFLTGLKLLVDMVWLPFAKMPPHMPALAFYVTVPPLMVVLYYQGVEFGVTYIARGLRIPWWIIPAVFIICGLAMSQPRQPRTYTFLMMPKILYALAVIHGILVGALPGVELIAAFYLFNSVLSSVANIRQGFEKAQLAQEVRQLRLELTKGSTTNATPAATH